MRGNFVSLETVGVPRSPQLHVHTSTRVDETSFLVFLTRTANFLFCYYKNNCSVITFPLLHAIRSKFELSGAFSVYVLFVEFLQTRVQLRRVSKRKKSDEIYENLKSKVFFGTGNLSQCSAAPARQAESGRSKTKRRDATRRATDDGRRQTRALP